MPTFKVVIGSLLSRATPRPPSARSRQARLPRPGTRKRGSSLADGHDPAALRASALPRRGRFETNQPFAIRAVQCERVVNAVRLFQRHRHSRHHKPNPMATVRVDHENLSVEVEKHIEGWIARRRHGILLSY